MKISVLIPTYNSARYIRSTLESVLAQTRPADEILVIDDGSTDETVSILRSYGDRVSWSIQPNGGVARTRNNLVAKAQGDLLAFLDHDDLWHPQYLATQAESFRRHPEAAAVFTKHITFSDEAILPEWQKTANANDAPELIAPDTFITRYNRSDGTFYSMSFCAIPKAILTRLGPEVFAPPTAGVDDFFLCNQFPLYGPVVLNHGRLVAYRLSPNAQSLDRLKNFGLILTHYDYLKQRFQAANQPRLLRLIDCEYASKQRYYGKILFHLGRKPEARRHFAQALCRSLAPASMAKSLVLLVQSFLPPPFAVRGNSQHRN